MVTYLKIYLITLLRRKYYIWKLYKPHLFIFNYFTNKSFFLLSLSTLFLVEAPSPPEIEYNWSMGEVPEWIFEYEPSQEEVYLLLDFN